MSKIDSQLNKSLRSNRIKSIIKPQTDLSESTKNNREIESEKIVNELRSKNRKKIKESNDKNRIFNSINTNTINLPSNQNEYYQRLMEKNKEIQKNPPEMPPMNITINKETKPIPSRLPNNDLIFEDYLEFTPNVTPEEVLRSGAFGGTYFRPIHSAVTNISYQSADVLADSVAPDWITNLNIEKQLTSPLQDASVNKQRVKCGGSLGMWESSGWIAPIDPQGWFQWQCRFQQGRRSDDDERQVGRWSKCAGPNGRFRNQLLNKILAANKGVDDATVSPVIRQTLLHWGFEPTREILEKHRNKKK